MAVAWCYAPVSAGGAGDVGGGALQVFIWAADGAHAAVDIVRGIGDVGDSQVTACQERGVVSGGLGEGDKFPFHVSSFFSGRFAGRWIPCVWFSWKRLAVVVGCCLLRAFPSFPLVEVIVPSWSVNVICFFYVFLPCVHAKRLCAIASFCPCSSFVWVS